MNNIYSVSASKAIDFSFHISSLYIMSRVELPLMWMGAGCGIPAQDTGEER